MKTIGKKMSETIEKAENIVANIIVATICSYKRISNKINNILVAQEQEQKQEQAETKTETNTETNTEIKKPMFIRTRVADIKKHQTIANIVDVGQCDKIRFVHTPKEFFPECVSVYYGENLLGELPGAEYVKGHGSVSAVVLSNISTAKVVEIRKRTGTAGITGITLLIQLK